MSENQRERKALSSLKADIPLDHFVRKRVGEKVHEARTRLGYSQEELCARAGLNRTYLSDIERGEGNATLTVLTKISAALQTSLSELFSGVETGIKSAADILIADSNQGQVRLRRILEGHQVVGVQHLKDAKKCLDECQYDLIIGGLHFSDGRIFDLLRYSKISESNRNTPFVCLRDSINDGSMTPFLRQALSISVSALGGSALVESEKFGRNHDSEVRLRKEIEHWLPTHKRLWTD